MCRPTNRPNIFASNPAIFLDVYNQLLEQVNIKSCMQQYVIRHIARHCYIDSGKMKSLYQSIPTLKPRVSTTIPVYKEHLNPATHVHCAA